MSDLTANTNRAYRAARNRLALPSTSGEEYYAGAAVGIKLSTGRAVAISASGNEHVRFVGFCEQRVTGDGSNFVPVRVDGAVVESVSVTGASMATDTGRLVYMTDDQTFTLTRAATDAVPVGIVSRYRSGTTCDVLALSAAGAFALDAARPKQTLLIGTVGLRGAVLDDIVARQPLYGHGRIVSFHAYTAHKQASGSNGESVFELLLGTTSLGDIKLTSTTGASGLESFAAATSTDTIDARFSDGDVVTVKLKTATTAWNSSGAASFYIDVVPA